MLKMLFAAFLSITGVAASKAQNADAQKEIRTNVNWIWGEAGNEPPASIPAWFKSVPFGNGIRGIRWTTGPRDYGNIAVLFALAGMRDEAMEWLNTAQSHNNTVTDLFDANQLHY